MRNEYYKLVITNEGKLKKTATNDNTLENLFFYTYGIMLGTVCKKQKFENAKNKLVKKVLKYAQRELKLAEKKYNSILNIN